MELMTYDEYIDAVCECMPATLGDWEAVSIVMEAKMAGFFNDHYDLPERRRHENVARDVDEIMRQVARDNAFFADARNKLFR